MCFFKDGKKYFRKFFFSSPHIFSLSFPLSLSSLPLPPILIPYHQIVQYYVIFLQIFKTLSEKTEIQAVVYNFFLSSFHDLIFFLFSLNIISNLVKVSTRLINAIQLNGR